MVKQRREECETCDSEGNFFSPAAAAAAMTIARGTVDWPANRGRRKSMQQSVGSSKVKHSVTAQHCHHLSAPAASKCQQVKLIWVTGKREITAAKNSCTQWLLLLDWMLENEIEKGEEKDGGAMRYQLGTSVLSSPVLAWPVCVFSVLSPLCRHSRWSTIMTNDSATLRLRVCLCKWS